MHGCYGTVLVNLYLLILPKENYPQNMKYFEIIDIFVRFYVLLYLCQTKNSQMEAQKNTYIAFVDELKFYTLKIPLDVKMITNRLFVSNGHSIHKHVYI